MLEKEKWRLKEYIIIYLKSRWYTEEQLISMSKEELTIMAKDSGRNDMSKIRFEVLTPQEAREAGIHINPYNIRGLSDDQYKLVCMYYRRKEQKDGKTKTDRPGKGTKAE